MVAPRLLTPTVQVAATASTGEAAATLLVVRDGTLDRLGKSTP